MICLGKVVNSGSIGQKALRLCFLQGKTVRCHGVCRGAFVYEKSGETKDIMCPVYVEVFGGGLKR